MLPALFLSELHKTKMCVRNTHTHTHSCLHVSRKGVAEAPLQHLHMTTGQAWAVLWMIAMAWAAGQAPVPAAAWEAACSATLEQVSLGGGSTTCMTRETQRPHLGARGAWLGRHHPNLRECEWDVDCAQESGG